MRPSGERPPCLAQVLESRPSKRQPGRRKWLTTYALLIACGREDRRTDVLNGVFAEAVAWVSWDDDRPGYESISSLTKVVPAAGREALAKPSRKPSTDDVEERTYYPRSQWPRAQVPMVA